MAFEMSNTSVERLEMLYPKADSDVINSLAQQCADEFMAICNRDDVPCRAESIIEQMVAYRLSQINAEGLASQSFSGMSEAYLTDYPERLKRSMYNFRRLGLR